MIGIIIFGIITILSLYGLFMIIAEVKKDLGE